MFINLYSFFYLFLFLNSCLIIAQEKNVIVDSDFSYEQVINNYPLQKNIKDKLVLISVEYFSFDNLLHRGQIVIHKDLAKDIIEIFEMIKQKKFPIEKVIPINYYNWSDEASMEANNTSAFNFRKVKESKKMSAHALGRAIDINPKQNPHIKNGKYYPPNSDYDPKREGTITANSFIVKEFKKRGWSWGGNWKSSKDYQHFEKLK